MINECKIKPILEIKNALKKALEDMGITSLPDINVNTPEDLTYGDFTSNIAFIVSRLLHKSPEIIGHEIIDKITKTLTIMKYIQVVKPGFINFYLNHNTIITQASEMLKVESEIGSSNIMEKKLIMIEFTDPNPFKEFHVGHLYNNIVGESLARLLESQGAIVKRVCYQGDIGLHVAKAVWGMKFLSDQMPSDNSSPEDRANFMGKSYALGANAYEDSKSDRDQIIKINKQLYERSDKEIMEFYTKGRKWSLDYFDIIYRRLGTHFDIFYFESKAGPIGLKYVREHISDNIFEIDNGAIIFRGEKYGLHTRVFINSLGLPTYEAKELGLAVTKYKDFPYEQSIIVTANEIDGYFKVLLKVLEILNPKLAQKTIHISHGVVKLPGGKMSSRKGNIITGEWLLNEAKKKAEHRINETKKTEELYTNDSRNVINEQVGTGAVKYALLKTSLGKDIEFDFEKSVSFEGNAGPYLQYTFVRTQAIIKKSQSQITYDFSYIPQVDEDNILRITLKFQEVIQISAKNLSPNTLTTYLYNLAKLFNTFYQKYRISDANSLSEINFRYMLTILVGSILKRGLFLLGIAAPSSM